MLKKILLLSNIIVLLSSCSEEKIEESAAKKQIKEYNQTLEDCKENASKNKPKEKKVEDKEVPEKKVFDNGFTRRTDDIVLGNLDSNTIVVEYFSPTCPHCVSYHKKIFPEIKRKYIDTGKIQYIIREFIGNKQDLDATVLARCPQNQDTYFKFMNVILEKQDSWAYSKNYREILTNIGALGGISAETYATCLNDESKIKNLIKNTTLLAKEPRFIGTPTFFINGTQFTKPYTFEELSKVIEASFSSDGQK